MNETKFDFTYFFETLVQRVLFIAMNIPVVYTTVLTVYILLIFNLQDNMIILYAALGLGVVLKLMFTITSKTKKLKTELITLVVDLGLGLLVILFTGFTYEIIVLSLSLLYLLYYSYVMTISYTRLGHNTEEMLRDLSHRHENQNKKEK